MSASSPASALVCASILVTVAVYLLIHFVLHLIIDEFSLLNRTFHRITLIINQQIPLHKITH